MPSDPLGDYKKLLAKEQNLGDKYVIIDYKWFEHWKRFVGIDKSDEAEVTDPGPIDFINLAHPDAARDPTEVQLRSDAVEGNDYTFIPYELYTILLKNHSKSGTEIVRKVIPRGQYDTVIEASLVPLRLRQSTGYAARVKQVYRSRRTRVSDLMKELTSEFSLSSNSNYRLVASTDDKGTEWEPIDDGPDKYIEDIDLTKNAYITVESRTISTRSSSSILSWGRQSYTPGLCGLSNLGNTCFMNSALQCLSNVPQLTDYFLHDEYKLHINRDNPLGMKGDVAEAYGELVHNIWSGQMGSCAPKSLKHYVARYAPQFGEHSQQNLGEFMSFLLDSLHEDLNLVKQKPYVQRTDDDGTVDDTTLAAEQWDCHCKRNQSKIQDIFHGQIRTAVQCQTCATSQRSFDPICFLSLPLPGKSTIRTFKLAYVRLNGQIKTYSIKLEESKHMADLVEKFCLCFQPSDNNARDAITASAGNQDEIQREDFTNEPDYDGHQPKPDFILPVEVYNHRIHLQYSDNSLLSSIIEHDQIVFYEVPESVKSKTNGTILMPCVLRNESNRQNFGYPIYLSIPRNDCRGRDIQEALKKTIGNYLPLSSVDSSAEPLYTGLLLTNQKYYQQTRSLDRILGEHIRFGPLTASLTVEVASSVVDKYTELTAENIMSSNTLTDRFSSLRSQSKQPTTLVDCLKHFTKKEILSSDDLWKCPKCNELKRASKKIDLWLLPKVLIVQLKRFNYTHDSRSKSDLLIDCPLRDLDLSEFVLNPDEKPKAKYDLIAVSNHSGSMEDGHYTAGAKNVRNNKWYTFNDSSVSEISEDNVISKDTHLLVYQQQGRI